MEIEKQIKKYRTKMNFSQDELAQRIFVSRQTISNWENNKSYPDVKSLLLLSSLFNISLDIEIYRQKIWFCNLEYHWFYVIVAMRKCMAESFKL